MTQFSELLIDSALALLLVGAIVVCGLVYRRLGTIREGQSELKALVDQLSGAASDAQRGVEVLKSAADEIESRLQHESQKASVIADELALMSEAGNNLADRIEKGLTGAGSASNPSSNPVQQQSKKQQKEILAALREAR